MNVLQLTAGAELPSLKVPPITRTMLALFAGASGDHQPTHLDIDAARAKGRNDVIVHGMLMMAYLAKFLAGLVPQDRVRSYKARFVSFTPVLAEPLCTGRVSSVEGHLATLDLEIRLADGSTVVLGEAVVDIS